jgi:hypothetical protein
VSASSIKTFFIKSSEEPAEISAGSSLDFIKKVFMELALTLQLHFLLENIKD